MSRKDEIINGVTPDNLAPAERARFESAIADAYQRGKQEGRGEVLTLLTRIVKATSKNQRLVMIKNAEEELKKWGGVE